MVNPGLAGGNRHGRAVAPLLLRGFNPGLARFVFTPTSGFAINYVNLSFDTGGSASIYNASPDGVWRTSIYTGALRNGPANLYTIDADCVMVRVVSHGDTGSGGQGI